MSDNSKMVGPEEAAKIAARMKSLFGPEGPPETKPDDAIAPAQTVQMELAALRARIRTIEVRTTVTAWDALSRQQATGNPDEIERANHARKLGQAALNAAECEKNPCPDGDVEFVSRLTVLIPSGIHASDASRETEGEDALALIAAERRRADRRGNRTAATRRPRSRPRRAEGASDVSDAVDLCEVARELERVHVERTLREVYAIAADRTTAFWSGYALACEEMAARLGFDIERKDTP